jgi:hypothetical protein
MTEKAQAKRGRKPFGEKAMSGNLRQRHYLAERDEGLEELARALCVILKTDKASRDYMRTYFGPNDIYGADCPGARMLKGLAFCMRRKNEINAENLVFFRGMMGLSSSDEKP